MKAAAKSAPSHDPRTLTIHRTIGPITIPLNGPWAALLVRNGMAKPRDGGDAILSGDRAWSRLDAETVALAIDAVRINREKRLIDTLSDIASSLRELQHGVSLASLPAVTRALIEKQAIKADAAIAEAKVQ